ncbi:MAG TPA: GNAT family N-acetyltransferase [Capsulimonadaceae bacterium]|jgi:GNAT superfamily N-acetyltransferase
MEVTLSPALEEDREFCRQAHHEAYRDVVERQFGAWDEAMQDRFFSRTWWDVKLEIVHVDGVRAGCFSREEHDDALFLRSVFLLSDFQRRGVGTQLIQATLTEATTRNLPIIVRLLNLSRARPLLLRLGFKDTTSDVIHRYMEWASPK